MKIICISTSLIPAPTAHSMQLMKVCQALAQLGHQVELVIPGYVGEPWTSLSKHYGLTKRFDIKYIRSRNGLRRYDFALAAVRYAAGQKPCLAYTWLLPAAVMALCADIPTVLELHDRVTGMAAPWLFRRFIASRNPKRLAVITSALVKKLKAEFSKSEGYFDAIIAPNGVEFEKYTHLPSTRAARKQLGLPEKLTVVYSGSFYSGRGIELLYQLARQNQSIQFIWAGGTPSSIREWQQKLLTDDLHNVHLPGFINNSELPLYQAAADILVMPFGTAIAGSSGGDSAEICSPMKMFDYLASGRAIMASDLPVLHEVLNELNAILLPPHDTDAWQKALTHLAEDEKLRVKLGNNAHRDASRYTWLQRETSILKGFPPR